MNPAVFHVMLKRSVAGSFVGVLCFFVFAIFYFRASGFLKPNIAIGREALEAVVTKNPYFWSVCVLMVVLCCLIGYMWPVAVTPNGIPLKG